MYNARTTADMESEGRMQKFLKKMKTKEPMRAKKQMKLKDLIRKKRRGDDVKMSKRYYA